MKKHSDIRFGAFLGILTGVLICAESSINGTSVSNTSEKDLQDLKLSGSTQSLNASTQEHYESTVTVLSKPSQNTIRIPLRIGKALGPPFVKILNRRLSIRLDTSNDISSKNSSTDASDDIISMEIIVNNTSENRTETTRFIMEPYNNSVDVTKTDMSTSHTPNNYTNKGNMSSSSSLFEKLTARILGIVATSTTTTTPETPSSSLTSTSIIETNSRLVSKPLSFPVLIHRSQNQEEVPSLFQSFQTLATGRSKSNNQKNNNQKSNSLQDHGHQRTKQTETTSAATTKPQARSNEQRKGLIGGFLGNFFNMFRETRKIISSTFRNMASRLIRFPQEQEEKRQRRIKSELKRDRLVEEES